MKTGFDMTASPKREPAKRECLFWESTFGEEGSIFSPEFSLAAPFHSTQATALNTTGKLYVQQSSLGDELCAKAAAKNRKPTASRFGDFPADETTVSPCYIEPNKALDGSAYDTFVVRDLVGIARRAVNSITRHVVRRRVASRRVASSTFKRLAESNFCFV